METKASPLSLGIVVIGRNEGERLKVGLRAIKRMHPKIPVIYVDSGSEDDSISFAKSQGIDTVELDTNTPFTAARARNTGFYRLIEQFPDLKFIQFLDGDCELLPNWLETASKHLSEHSNIGIVSGRRSERFPNASVYNYLIDMEWNTTPGDILAVLGDMCVKVEAFSSINGFDATIIAGEDFDFCLRAKSADYKTFRIDANMSKHDVNITKISQWYQRMKRGGHAYANLHHLHGKGSEKHFKKEVRSALIWGGTVPIAFITCLFLAPNLSLFILAAYFAFACKVILSFWRKSEPLKTAITYGLLIFSGKISEFTGILKYYKNYLLSRKHVLIEYK